MPSYRLWKSVRLDGRIGSPSMRLDSSGLAGCGGASVYRRFVLEIHERDAWISFH